MQRLPDPLALVLLITLLSVGAAAVTPSPASGDVFQAPFPSYQIGLYPWRVATADLNGNGWLDIVTACAGTAVVLHGWGDARKIARLE